MKLMSFLCMMAAVPLFAQSGRTRGDLPIPQRSPFVLGESIAFRSQVLDQQRTLHVYLPEGYAADSAHRYPVVYALDGSANEDFPHLAGLVQYLNMYALYPKSIVVGVANVDRKHDFTHPTRNDSDRAWVANSGGSAPFIRFIADEVQPMVDKHYRTDGHRTLVGQSLGGLLGTEILFGRPELFDDYVLVSSSLWWDGGSLAEHAATWAKAHATDPRRVFIAVARDDDMAQDGIDRVVAALKDHTKPPLQWWYEEFPEETHATVLHRAVYRAFERLGAGKP